MGERVTMGFRREVRDTMRDDISKEEQPETSTRQSSGVANDWGEWGWCLFAEERKARRADVAHRLLERCLEAPFLQQRERVSVSGSGVKAHLGLERPPA